MCFFFFKQKTAYEMRISDWSSDVCSSDLHVPEMRRHVAQHLVARDTGIVDDHVEATEILADFGGDAAGGVRRGDVERQADTADLRSEEHTSELQSLMRISYAVFCLKKKNNMKQHQETHNLTALI